MGVHLPVLHSRGAGGEGGAMGGPGVTTLTDRLRLRLDAAREKALVIGNQIGKQAFKLNLITRQILWCSDIVNGC